MESLCVRVQARHSAGRGASSDRRERLLPAVGGPRPQGHEDRRLLLLKAPNNRKLGSGVKDTMATMKYRMIFLAISLVALCGCGRDERLPVLTDIYGYVSSEPQKALEALDSIDYAGLSSSNRHFYDLLSVKANDKAYVEHTSDSLILDVMDYYSSRNDAAMYAEALYYGGRVYSDLGDYPSALKYFQKALDILPSDPDNLDLRACIISQTGRLLNKLRLFHESASYIQTSIEIARQRKDTVNTIYDLQLLGNTYLRAKEYDLAEGALYESLRLSEGRPGHHKAKTKMYLAAAKYGCGQLDSALSLIRHTPDYVNQRVSRNYALGYAACIYRDKGIPDTAYMYAHEIITSPNPGPREVGFHVLLSPELRHLISQDTLDAYLSRYVDLLENYYKENEIQLAINQQNLYNYDLHERDKIKAQLAVERMRYWIAGFIFLVFLLVIIVLYFKNRSKSRLLELHEALENIKELRARIKEDILSDPSDAGSDRREPNPELALETDTPKAAHDDNVNKEDCLREQLKSELLALYEQTKANPKRISSLEIIQSSVYQKIKEKAANDEIIPEDDSLWTELEKTILKSSPRFKQNLTLLSMGNLSLLELHTAYLIKCGLRPSEMEVVLGRTHGAIVSRRQSICEKILGENKGLRIGDAIIRLM